MSEGNYFSLSEDYPFSSERTIFPGKPGCESTATSATQACGRDTPTDNVEQVVGQTHALDVRHRGAKQFNNSPSPQLSSTFSAFSISKDTSSAQCVTNSPLGLGTKSVASSGSPLSGNASLDSRNDTADTDTLIKKVTPAQLQQLLDSQGDTQSLLLDMRTFASFQISRVRTAINISIPATLLKRSSYTMTKIADSLRASKDGTRLRHWYDNKRLFLYDSDSFHVGPGTAIYQFAKKFVHVDFAGELYTVIGGFAAIMREASVIVDRHPLTISEDDAISRLPGNGSKLSLRALGDLTCALPTKQASVNPFFNNIRQNQDLIGGVGDPIPLQLPPDMERFRSRLPAWLVKLAFHDNGPKIIADKFLKIEQDEQQRMKRVLNAGEQSGDACEERHSIAAGVERGDKNRYNNIWPFENARVRLQDLTYTTSDYVNASYLHVKDSAKHYIATQGPLPGTTRDFWQMVWENDVRVVIMLTKTVEGGQNKCHPYWEDEKMMAPYHLDLLEQVERGTSGNDADTVLTIRKFNLTDTAKPLAPPREITHIQFPEWPDFYVIGPDAILSLIKEVNIAQSNVETPAVKRRKSVSLVTSTARATRPILSHCSAGCGRTGVFCTIDTVLGIVRKQLEQSAAESDTQLDLVEYVVRSYREQRLSIVQTYADPSVTYTYD